MQKATSWPRMELGYDSWALGLFDCSDQHTSSARLPCITGVQDFCDGDWISTDEAVMTENLSKQRLGSITPKRWGNRIG